MVVMRPYSEDLRARIVAAVEGGMTKSEASRLFGVSPSSVKRYGRLAANEEPLAPRKGGGRPPKTNAAIERLLEEDVSRRPYAAVRERAAFVRAASGVALSVSTVRRLLRRLGFSQKTEPGCVGARRVREVCLEGGGLGKARGRAPRVRRRDGLQHLALAAVRMVEGRRAPAGRGPEELGQEPHAAFEHEHRRHGTVGGGGGGDHQGGLRGLRRAGAGSEPLAGTGGGHGQPLRPQGRKGAGARRGGGMRAALPAALLPGHEPYRGGLLEGEGDLAKSSSPNPRNADRSHETGAGVGGRFGRPRLLRTPRVPRCYGSTVLTDALGCRRWDHKTRRMWPGTRPAISRGWQGNSRR